MKQTRETLTRKKQIRNLATFSFRDLAKYLVPAFDTQMIIKYIALLLCKTMSGFLSGL